MATVNSPEVYGTYLHGVFFTLVWEDAKKFFKSLRNILN